MTQCNYKSANRTEIIQDTIPAQYKLEIGF